MIVEKQNYYRELLTDAQWELLECQPEIGRAHAVGRKPSDDRQIFEAVLWVIKHQARWQELPEHYPSPRTCQRRLKRWMNSPTWCILWRDYLRSLDADRLAMWLETFEVLAMRQSRGGDHRIGRPPFWRAAAMDFWWHTWEVQPPQVRQRLRDIVEPLMRKSCCNPTSDYAPSSC